MVRLLIDVHTKPGGSSGKILGKYFGHLSRPCPQHLPLPEDEEEAKDVGGIGKTLEVPIKSPSTSHQALLIVDAALRPDSTRPRPFERRRRCGTGMEVRSCSAHAIRPASLARKSVDRNMEGDYADLSCGAADMGAEPAWDGSHPSQGRVRPLRTSSRENLARRKSHEGQNPDRGGRRSSRTASAIPHNSVIKMIPRIATLTTPIGHIMQVTNEHTPSSHR